GPYTDILAPDVNTGAREMGCMHDEYSRMYGAPPPTLTGQPIALGGSLGREPATGRGGFLCLDRIAHHRGWTREKIRVAVEGYGNASSWLCIVASAAGCPMGAVSGSA